MKTDTALATVEVVDDDMESVKSGHLIGMIERAARDPTFDVNKLAQLLALQEKVMARNAEVAFNRSMRNAQEEMPRVHRDAENSHTRSRYARLESVLAAITPTYTRHGFSLSFGTADCPKSNHCRVTCKVSHVDGHSRDYQCDVPSDGAGAKGNANKTETHAFGSTMSYARRYLTLLIFNIALTNEDTDANPQPERDDDAPKAPPRAERSAIQVKRAEVVAAWKSKNEQRIGETDGDYKTRFIQWGNLKLGRDNPDAELALDEKQCQRLLEALK